MELKLSVPELRVLRVLACGALLSRQKIGERCGLSKVSGTVTRAFNGLREGSSSGAARPGLLKLGLVEELRIDIEEDGIHEVAYRITDAGAAVLMGRGEELPALRDRESSTNKRYQID